jgi:hypothetical protein
VKKIGYPPSANLSYRYQIMFGNTHRFLPIRNGLVPNTAHSMLDLATAATPSGVTSKAANGGHFKTGQRKLAWD